MLGLNRIRWRLALAIFFTALIPLLVSVVLARSMVQQSSSRFFMPELRGHLEQALEVYGELARELKGHMRQRASAMANDAGLLAVVSNPTGPSSTGGSGSASPRNVDRRALAQILKRFRDADPALVEVRVVDDAGQSLGEAMRANPLEEGVELPLRVVRPIADANGRLQLHAMFATPARRFQEFQEYGEFIEAYAKLEERRSADEQTYVLAFAVLLGITILGATGVGTLLARGVATRVTALAAATHRVGAGDLSVRVDDDSGDELGELARAFNHMLEEVENSRSRIEYLSRVASWQEMARRLAHEIKNPLTPIQLAVQEMHQRLSDVGPQERRLLDTTLEIVETEVSALRHLVGEFSEFARLPQSRVERRDLLQFLRGVQSQSDFLPEVLDARHGADSASLQFELASGAAMVRFDEQMMRRVLVNLVQNAVQAAASASRQPKISITARVRGKQCELSVEDNGAGVPDHLRTRVFEPYVTTRDDGTGLGLAIVKKVVLDHGGTIRVSKGKLGGARFTIGLPLAGPRQQRADTYPPPQTSPKVAGLDG